MGVCVALRGCWPLKDLFCLIMGNPFFTEELLLDFGGVTDYFSSWSRIYRAHYFLYCFNRSANRAFQMGKVIKESLYIATWPLSETSQNVHQLNMNFVSQSGSKLTK